MTIDEAIARERQQAKEQRSHIDTWDEEYSKRCEECAEEHEQLANWLEELVMLRLEKCMIHMPERLQLVENGYNKALNDFVHKVKEHQYVLSDVINSKDYGMFTIGIEQIAEQLKAGGENE